MLYLPEAVISYTYKLTLENRSPAYLLVQNKRLFSWGGKLSLYGLTNLKQGEYVEKKYYF